MTVLFDTVAHAALAALDRYHAAVMILDPELHVVARNLAAERLLGRRDGLSLDAIGRPHAFRRTDDERLQRAIRAPSAGTLVPLARPSGRDPLLAEACTIAGANGVLLLVVDPNEGAIVCTRALATLYGLTPAEAEVCRLMASGLSTDEIADVRDVSVETVRVQSKQVLQKTGARSRSRLVRLAMSVSLPLLEAS
ncbi:MAG TPA: LuxR C-terminal-related transcriptional regulator [Candidatus Polarisedimenticolaceae bacterium]|nr:LuxR C-terminal-related transcriptional regulator [Candidatus Polarisedimenticolaceae bacterium]